MTDADRLEFLAKSAGYACVLTADQADACRAGAAAIRTLAAVRKIADDYHDVDVVGDPPHEVACNPCANDILNVLEGK